MGLGRKRWHICPEPWNRWPQLLQTSRNRKTNTCEMPILKALLLVSLCVLCVVAVVVVLTRPVAGEWRGLSGNGELFIGELDTGPCPCLSTWLHVAARASCQ